MSKINKKFNITELIEYYYQEKMPLPDKLKSFDYTEINKKTIKFIDNGKENTFPFEEAIGHNIIRELPLEAYKDLFNLNWALKTYNSNHAIYSAFEGKRFDFLEHVINEVNSLQSSDFNKKEFNGELRNYATSILIPIRDCFSNVNFGDLKYTKKDIENLYIIWEKALTLLEDIQPQIWMGINTRKSINIFDKYEIVQESSKDGGYTLMRDLNTPLTFDIFKKIFNNLSKTNKQRVFIDADNSIAEEAIYSCNRKVVEFLEKEKLITSNNYINVLIDKYDIDSLKLNTNKISSNDIWLYKKIQESISNEEKLQITAYQITGLIKYFEKNEIIVNEIFHNYPQIQTGNILEINNSSLAEIKLAFNTLNHMGIDEKEIISHFTKRGRYGLDLFPRLIERFPQTPQFNISDIIASPLGEELTNYIADKNNISKSNAKTLFLEAGIDLNLKPQTITDKRVKI